MKLEDQVCSLELAKRLKELGVKQESYFYWVEDRGEWVVRRNRSLGFVHLLNCSAFTVGELGEMLPEDTPSDRTACWMQVSEDGDETYWDNVNDGEGVPDPHIIRGGTEADMRAKMLIYLIENKLVKP